MERWENVEGVFEVTHPMLVKDRRILLTDDVVTTGASLEACGEALLGAGCKTLHIATVAFAEQ
jgi:predicted amidophosphoribosyltransferase